MRLPGRGADRERLRRGQRLAGSACLSGPSAGEGSRTRSGVSGLWLGSPVSGWGWLVVSVKMGMPRSTSWGRPSVRLFLRLLSLAIAASKLTWSPSTSPTQPFPRASVMRSRRFWMISMRRGRWRGPFGERGSECRRVRACRGCHRGARRCRDRPCGARSAVESRAIPPRSACDIPLGGARPGAGRGILGRCVPGRPGRRRGMPGWWSVFCDRGCVLRCERAVRR